MAPIDSSSPPVRWPSTVAAAAAACVAAGMAFVFFHDAPLVRVAMLDAGQSTEHAMLGVLFPFLSDVGLVAALLWALTAWGLAKQSNWVSGLLAAALVLSVVSGFMPVPPTASRGVFPSSAFTVLLPALGGFALIARRHLGWSWGRVAFLAALAFAAQFAFMNGVASTHRMLDGRGAIYVYSQRIHGLAMLGWGTAAVALSVGRAWALPAGRWVATATVFAGLPLALADSFALGRPSLFSVSPGWSLVLLVVLLVRPPSEAP